MDEKEFLKQLNSKNNLDGIDTYLIIQELLEEPLKITQEPEKLPIVPEKKENFFKRIFKFLKKESVSEQSIVPEEPKEKSPKQIINDNIDNILGKIANGHYSKFLTRLVYDDSLIEIVGDNLTKILDRFPADANGKYFKSDFFRILTLREKGKELIDNNIDTIMEHKDFDTLDAITLSKVSEETDEKLNEFLGQNINRLARELLQGSISYDRSSDIEGYVNSVGLILKELFESENVKFTDMKTLMSGGYSKVYQIGSKVLKMGIPRKTYEIPNHPRILQPIARANLKDDQNIPFECIEVSDVVDELKINDENNELLYQIYSELRDAGIVWTDAKISNLGILRKSNTQEINGQKINVEPESIGFSERIKEGVYNIGDIVILDTDYIYNENDPNIDWSANSDSVKFDDRWENEKKIKAKAMKMQESEENKIQNDGEMR